MVLNDVEVMNRDCDGCTAVAFLSESRARLCCTLDGKLSYYASYGVVLLG